MSVWLKKIKVQIEKNPNIEKITRNHIVYTQNFKIQLVENHKKGISPIESFRRAGFNVSLFPKLYIKDAVANFIKIERQHGSLAFTRDHRGKGAVGRKSKNIADLLKL